MSHATKTVQVLTLKSLLFLDTHLSTKLCQEKSPFPPKQGEPWIQKTPEGLISTFISIYLMEWGRYQLTSKIMPEAGRHNEFCKVSDPCLQVSRRGHKVSIRTSEMPSIIYQPLSHLVCALSSYFLTSTLPTQQELCASINSSSSSPLPWEVQHVIHLQLLPEASPL